MKPNTKVRTGLYAGIGLLLIVALVLAVILPLASRSNSTNTGARPTATQAAQSTNTSQPTQAPTVTPTPGDTNPAQGPGIRWGLQACPASVSNPGHWDSIVGTQSGVKKVESVSCANIMGTPSLQALVTVRYSGSMGKLDVYVYTTITNATPTRLFKLQGLLRGDAKISGYNTVMTAEADEHSPINKGKAEAQLKQDLYREFKWFDGAGILVQVAFPGLFPDLTRYQAEADQAQVNAGHQPWKLSATMSAQALAATFLPWQRPTKATIVSGGGPQDVDAIVHVEEAALQGGQSPGPSINVIMSRLEGNTHNIWVAIGVTDGNLLSVTNLQARNVITSPVTIEGTGSAFEAVIGKAFVLDHLYGDIGHAQVLGQGMATGPYTVTVAYDTTFHRGLQEGIVEVQEANGGISDEPYTTVLVKVLITPEPGVVLGARACPASVASPAYWNQFISGYGPNTPVADSVNCANMKGLSTLQVMIVAHEIVGGGPLFRAVFVFDNITSTQPTLLFKQQHMRHGTAKISSDNTVMTSEVDINSPLNKGKPDSAMQNDLFREFKWSDGAGILVQTTFPGLFPNLTRYQAEADQAQQATGSWKYNAVTVAKDMAIQMFKWSSTSQATPVSGGGPQDVEAFVKVRSTGPDHPVITVELSRLEGNTHNIWEVVGVTSSSLAITWPPSGALLTSPVKVTGTGNAFEGQVGVVYVLDHLYNPIGQAVAKGTQGVGPTTFGASVNYTATFHGRAQEGILAVYSYSNANGAIAGVSIQKAMIQA